MLETFILIFWLGQGAGSAEFDNMAACSRANNQLEEVFGQNYNGVCVSKGEQS